MTQTIQLAEWEKKVLVDRVKRLVKEYEKVNNARMTIDLNYWLNNMVACYVDNMFTIIYTKDGLALRIWKGASISVEIKRIPEGEV